MTNHIVIIRPLRRASYEKVWQQMQGFTNARHADTTDEIWLIEHEPVYTLGQNGKVEHLLRRNHIPVIHSDRGGHITYHGPGQLIAYILVDIRRKKIKVREFVSKIENAIIGMLAGYGIDATNRANAPGVYVKHAKICSLGLRIRRGCSYHGLSLNVNMDLTPFQDINPCGYQGLNMTQVSQLGGPKQLTEIAPTLLQHLQQQLGYEHICKEENQRHDYTN